MDKLKLVIPKGKIFQNVINLLNEAGFNVRTSGRKLKPVTTDKTLEMKILKPKNIPQLVSLGSHDIGFAGIDWCIETQSNVEKVLDLGFDKVRLVSAIPENWEESALKKRKVVVVSEYENISKKYLSENGYDYLFLRVSGATEVFPPEDADMIIDNTATGTTLKENGLRIVDDIMTSSTIFIANPDAMKCDWKREKILEMKMLFESTINASKKVMLEMNIPADRADVIIRKLPCMKSPTVAKLFGEQGYSAKIVVDKKNVSKLIPELIALGATDILEYDINKVIVN